MSSTPVTAAASSDGTASSTTAKAPASCSDLASRSSLLAVLAAALNLVSAECVDRLWSQAKMRHHRDARGDELLDLPEHALTAF